MCCEHGIITHDGKEDQHWVPVNKYPVVAKPHETVAISLELQMVCQLVLKLLSRPTNWSVAAKIDFTVDSILAASKISNLGNIESTPLIFDITGHFVPKYRIWALQIGRSLFALLASILRHNHKPWYRIYIIINDSHSRLNSPIHRYIRYGFDSHLSILAILPLIHQRLYP